MSSVLPDGIPTALFTKQSPEQDLTPAPLKRVLTPEEDSEKLLYDDVFMDEAIQTYTLRSLTTSLSRIGYLKGVDCHNRAHEMGRRAYELLGGDSFKNCGIECHSGCRHGATEAFFVANGTSDLVKSMDLLCGSERSSQFHMHQCVHGVGHGLLAWFDYVLLDALKACDEINHSFHRSSCYSGVFMENIVGGITQSDRGDLYHYTEFLNDDPHYPCNAVSDKYQGQCYWLQTDRMLRLFGGDVVAVGVACADAPEQFQFSCFQSMGRTISGHFSLDPVKSFEVCSTVSNENNRSWCFSGSLSNLMWDETQADNAIAFCNLSHGSFFEKRCYDEMIIRVSQIIPMGSMRGFCDRLPERYRSQCMLQKASPANPLSVQGGGRQSTFILKTDNAIIRYENGVYTPNSVHISVGQEVVWMNDDRTLEFWPASNIHPTHAAYPGSDIEKCRTAEKKNIFDACKGISPGGKYSFVFSEVGKWRFHDHINPQVTGTVIVSE